MAHHHQHHNHHHNHHHSHHNSQSLDGYYEPPGGPPPGAYNQYDQGYAPPPFPPQGGGYGGYAPPAGPPPQGYGDYGSYNESREYQYVDQPMAVPHHHQSFHPELGNRYQFQYSQCTGRRKALLIGINYIGTKNQLRGCINDVLNISQFLSERYGFRHEDMVILRDDNPPNPAMIPTKANMIRAMHWLVDDAHPHDSLFFHYSGHGGQTVDFNSFQDDIYDETIYPVDFNKAGPILNTEMHDILVKRLPAGCRLTAIFDCCHSGSALALPYEYGANGLLKEPNVLHEAGRDFLDAFSSYKTGNIQQVLYDGGSLIKTLTRTEESREESRRTRTHPADVIQLSGCKNYQTSADTNEAGRATGAMSWAFKEVLSRNPRQSYNSLLVNVRELLAQKYDQKPVFSSCHPVDTRMEFLL